MKVVFLDRDGTINVDTGYVGDASELELIPGAGEALGSLKRAGYKLVVVSNQSGVGRGYFGIGSVQEVNEKLNQLLLHEDSDAKIDEFFICPHSPEDGCECRKPLAGMLPEDFLSKVSTEESYIIGDKLSDIDLGQTLKIPENQRILVLTGKGNDEWQKFEGEGKKAATVCKSLVKAAEFIVNN